MFTILDCGFSVRCALETSDASQIRIQKIYSLVGNCQFSIHDLSRTQLDETSRLPRFNMPLELGIVLGAKFLGTEKQMQKTVLILDKEPYQYQKYLSDIAGQDISFHLDDPQLLTTEIRNWLVAFSDEKIPSGSIIWERFQLFQGELRSLCRKAKHHVDELTYLEYLSYSKKFTEVKSDILTTGLEMRWGKELEEPSLMHIREALELLKNDTPNSFAILARSGYTYMQVAGSVAEGYCLEYQEGSIDKHYRCLDQLTTNEVVEAFQSYRERDDFWKTKFQWMKENIR